MLTLGTELTQTHTLKGEIGREIEGEGERENINFQLHKTINSIKQHAAQLILMTGVHAVLFYNLKYHDYST